MNRDEHATVVPALVLAAGLSRRMGQFKLLLPWADRTVIGQVVATLEAAGVGPIVVVAGHRAAEVETALAGSSARIVVNEDYASGEMLSSIQAGLRAVEHNGAGAALLCLGDQPQMRVETVKEVLAAGGRTRWAQVVIPSFQMRGGHPILLPRSLWAEILSARGTLRDVLARRRDQICYIPVDTPGVLADLDTPEDYAAARPRTGAVGDRPEQEVIRTGAVGDLPERERRPAGAGSYSLTGA
jgi:molybdenum cofactor cytidylyltransferase